MSLKKFTRHGDISPALTHPAPFTYRPPMKTGTVALFGALAGAGAMFGLYQIHPPGAEERATRQQELADARFDRDAARKVETRLRQQVAELRRATDTKLADTTPPPPRPAATDHTEDTKGENQKKNPVAEAMESFGKAQSDLAFKTLIARLGLEGDQLEAFTAIFDISRDRRQEAFSSMFGDGATLEQFAITGGATPDIDAWVAANLDDEAQDDYAVYKGEQEQNRIDRKANKELGMLGSIANLTAEQKDAAFGVFAEHVAAEPPEALLELSGPEAYSPYLDAVIASRIEALTPILDEEQITSYQEQSQLWRDIGEGMLKGATTSSDEEP